MQTYTIRITSDHAKAVCRALDLYERIAMGQTKEIGSEFEGKNGEWQQQREQGLDAVCEHLKQILCPDLQRNQYYGIMSKQTGKTAHLCYEVQKAILHRIAWTERPTAPADNDHFEPLLFPSGVNPRPECANDDGKQPELESSGYRLAKEIEEELGTTNIKEALRIIRNLKEKAEWDKKDAASGAASCSNEKHPKRPATTKNVKRVANTARQK